MNHRSRKSQKKSKSTSKTKKKQGKSINSPPDDSATGAHGQNDKDGGASSRRTWVDDLQFRPVAAPVMDSASASSLSSMTPVAAPSVSLSVISWNVLAHAYCSPRSQVRLPMPYQKRVFHGHHRRRNVVGVLERVASPSGNVCADVLCLQEVDMDEVRVALEGCGYRGVETPRTTAGAGGTGGRADSCSIFVNKETWKLVDHELVRLDDLATLASASAASRTTSGDDEAASPAAATTAANNLQGLQQSFLRRNVALLVRIQHVSTGETAVVANCHLYWVRTGYCRSPRRLHRARTSLNLPITCHVAESGLRVRQGSSILPVMAVVIFPRRCLIPRFFFCFVVGRNSSARRTTCSSGPTHSAGRTKRSCCAGT
jgi:hypothetical protein